MFHANRDNGYREQNEVIPESDKDAFDRLVDSPNGKVVNYMLTDHALALGES